jgi:peptidoglycan hydrolase CwlO-like protein
VFKTKDGKTLRNVPKFEEKMKNLQAEIDSHQKNIELLQKELDSLK